MFGKLLIFSGFFLLKGGRIDKTQYAIDEMSEISDPAIRSLSPQNSLKTAASNAASNETNWRKHHV